MKKILALILALTMVLGMLACSAQPETAAPDAAETTPAETVADAPADTSADTSAEAPEEAPTATEAVETGEEDQSQYFYDPDYYKRDYNADGKLKVAFICAGLASSWFAPKSAAMAKVAEENGIEYLAINGNSDENFMLQGLETCTSEGYDAIVWCLANASLVPTFVERCKEEGIVFISTDDGGTDYDGLFPPTVGLDNWALCNFSAMAMAQEAVNRGWDQDLDNLKIIVIDQTISDACHRRMNGATAAMKTVMPNLTDDNFLVIDQNGSLEDAVNKFSGAMMTAKSEAEHFIIYHYAHNVWDVCSAIIDENGIDWNNVLMGGLAQDGSVGAAFADSEAKSKALYLTGILSYSSGETIMNLLVDLFENGTPIPGFTSYDKWIVTADNAQKFMDIYNAAMEGM